AAFARPVTGAHITLYAPNSAPFATRPLAAAPTPFTLVRRRRRSVFAACGTTAGSRNAPAPRHRREASAEGVALRGKWVKLLFGVAGPGLGGGGVLGL
ncbi:hypothetical protein J7I98_14610, partial [Streptomyces sp. ISL-98]|uniref:hypothetical protein n=1 Tax=Streptomyces sp. ISL-98 TaxID=2819192 RepID=UPI001BEBAB12